MGLILDLENPCCHGDDKLRRSVARQARDAE